MIYLAGPIDKVSDNESHGWRDLAANYLSGTYNMAVFDPSLAFATTGLKEPDKIRDINFMAIYNSDVVLARVDHDIPAWGTAADIQYARMSGTPIVVWAADGGVPAYLTDLPCYRDLHIACEKAAQFGGKSIEGYLEEIRPVELLFTGGGIHSPKMDGDVGYDLVAMQTVSIAPISTTNGWAKVPIGERNFNLHLAVPEDSWATVWPRSSMVANGFLMTPTVIDPGYRGPIFAFLANITNEPQIIEAGTRCAQLILFPRVVYPLDEVADVEDLPDSERGHNGFGSTGK